MIIQLIKKEQNLFTDECEFTLKIEMKGIEAYNLKEVKQLRESFAESVLEEMGIL